MRHFLFYSRNVCPERTLQKYENYLIFVIIQAVLYICIAKLYFMGKICGEIRLKHSTTKNGLICDDEEIGNSRFCQSEDEAGQSDVPPQNDKHD